MEDPDCINSNTEMEETPLFFAVKNGYKDCVEVLLHWGASTGVFNLRLETTDLFSFISSVFIVFVAFIVSLNEKIC